MMDQTKNHKVHLYLMHLPLLAHTHNTFGIAEMISLTAESLYSYIMIPVRLARWAITIIRALLNVIYFIVNRFITFTIRT